ncbi:MAG: hypothetical protein ACKPIB_20230, partial [Dolichospermum sp.]
MRINQSRLSNVKKMICFGSEDLSPQMRNRFLTTNFELFSLFYLVYFSKTLAISLELQFQTGVEAKQIS